VGPIVFRGTELGAESMGKKRLRTGAGTSTLKTEKKKVRQFVSGGGSGWGGRDFLFMYEGRMKIPDLKGMD